MTGGIELTPFGIYNLFVGVLSAIGVGYLIAGQHDTFERRFIFFLGAGFLLFAIGGPLVDLFASDWVHVVHGIAALSVVFGLYDPVHNDLRTDAWVDLLFSDPSSVRHKQEWMRPVDEHILELFHSAHLVFSPAIVAYNIDYSTKEVNRRLTALDEHALLEKVDRGKYRLTELGESYMEGSLGEGEADSPD